ncbi:hypothetical protein [Rhodococcus sp. MTM3W5.2]|nr:hypothetical protein [Rhodococcus sp. MTM3W5.2]
MRDLTDKNESARDFRGEWLSLSSTSGRLFFAVTQAFQKKRCRLGAN